MKKIVAIVCCVLLLGGCTVIKENDENASPFPVQTAAAPEARGNELNATLYFLNADGEKLVSQPYTLNPEGTSPAAALVEALVAGPVRAGQKSVIDPGVTLDSVDVSDDLAIINMKTNGVTLSAKEMYIFAIAAADSLSDFLGISFVSVLWDGEVKYFPEDGGGLISKYTGNITQAWNKLQAQKARNASGSTQERRVALYFAAKDADYILPEMRNIVFTTGNYVQAIVNELIKGPKQTDGRNTVFNKNTILQSAKIEGDTALLDFAVLDRPSEFGDLESEIKTYASVVYSLTGFIPGVKNVRISVEGQEIVSLNGFKAFPTGMRREDYNGLIGKSIMVYLTQKDSGMLSGVSRTVDEESQWQPANRLAELFLGPEDQDSTETWPIIPTGVTVKDILSVSKAGELVTINLSNDFLIRCKGLTEENERLLVYGIVDTLTEMTGTGRVQFVIDGKEITELAGYLYMKSPFYRNPGLIKSKI